MDRGKLQSSKSKPNSIRIDLTLKLTQFISGAFGLLSIPHLLTKSRKPTPAKMSPPPSHNNGATARRKSNNLTSMDGTPLDTRLATKSSA